MHCGPFQSGRCATQRALMAACAQCTDSRVLLCTFPCIYFTVALGVRMFECNSAKEISRTARGSGSPDGAIYSRYYLGGGVKHSKSPLACEVCTLSWQRTHPFNPLRRAASQGLLTWLFFRSAEHAGMSPYFFTER